MPQRSVSGAGNAAAGAARAVPQAAPGTGAAETAGRAKAGRRRKQGAVINRAFMRDFFHLSDTKQENRVLDFIMDSLLLKEYRHDSFICRAGEKSDAMYFIESGTVNVLGSGGEAINELQPGHYFGEYAVLTGEKRMADIRGRGTVQVFELRKKHLDVLIRIYPKIYGLFLQKVYNQASDQYRNLVRILNQKRGLGVSRQKRLTPVSLFINYSLVFLIFFNLPVWAPPAAELYLHPLWMCSPIVFLVVYMVITRRALESLVLSAMFIAILAGRGRFVPYFSEHIIQAMAGTPDLIFMVVLMGSLTKLFSASGSINALRYIAREKIKTGKGTLFAAVFSMILISIDEYLMILINGACFTPLSDEKRIPREKSSFVLGMAPMALCILNPLSLTGIYLTGIITESGGGKPLFVQAIRFNFAAIGGVILRLLLVAGIFPRTGMLKKADERVQKGGPLWPEGTDNSASGDSANRGKVINLILPVFVLIAVSIAAGTMQEGSLSVDVKFGIIAALVVAFLLYCFQHYMTPEQFFNNIVRGVESMLAPIILFIVGKCFASGIEEIGFSTWLTGAVSGWMGSQGWLLPALIFAICTGIGAVFDNPWAMYAIGMPIALNLAATAGGPAGLFAGAVCAAGFMGNEIALGDIFFIGPMLGINPIAYYRSKLPYVLALAVFAAAAYAAAGWFLFPR
jgi:Na+/H+ antiporter NhaC